MSSIECPGSPGAGDTNWVPVPSALERMLRDIFVVVKDESTQTYGVKYGCFGRERTTYTLTSTRAHALEDAYHKLEYLSSVGDLAGIQELFSQWRSRTDSKRLQRNALAWFENTEACWNAAVKNYNIALVRYLLEQGFAPDSYLVSAAVGHALKTGDMGILELCLDNGWDINQARAEASPPLMACVLKSETLTRWCLARGASPNGSCPAGDTIMSAAGAEASLAVLRLLVEHGGRVDGCDCVMQASMAHAHGAPGRLEVVKYLLDLGAPIDAFMWEGTQLVGHKLSYSLLVGSQTALHWAVKEGKVDMVQLLLSRGADRNLKNQEYARNCCRTPIEIAEQQGLTAIADMLRSPPQSGNQDQKI